MTLGPAEKWPPLVRPARSDEIAWINACYDEVRFVHSDFTRELIAVAEIDGVRAGLGRLVDLGQADAELGGMYVLPEFRGRGVAKAIVEFLVTASGRYSRVFCLPFAHLAGFYGRFGFNPGDPGEAPAELLKKHAWCNQTYETPTLLLELRPLSKSLADPA